MRTIKFRGKSIETGEWLYGDLWRRQQNGQGTIYTFITHTGGRIERVDPDTVGQFTGLSDKNREEIYEGDILDFGGSLQQIEFDRGCFYMAQYEGADTVPWLLDIKYNEQSEIIGNIYENPELITNNK